MRDLGVTFDAKLLLDYHIDSIVTKASKALGFVLRMSAEFTDIKVIKMLYCAFVRSHLEYASQVWNPSYKTYISRLESIQKRFLRHLQYKCRIYIEDYTQRCKRFHFLPLYMRRNMNDIAFLLKIFQNQIDCSELLSLFHINAPKKVTRHTNILHVPSTRTNYHKNSFVIRVSNQFNIIYKDMELDLFNTPVNLFKTKFNKKFFSANEA